MEVTKRKTRMTMRTSWILVIVAVALETAERKRKKETSLRIDTQTTIW
jgi:hypothetical protein